MHDIALSTCNGYGNWCCLCTKSKEIIRSCLHTNTNGSIINDSTNNDNISIQCTTIVSKKEQLSWLLSTSCCIDNNTTITNNNDYNNDNTYDYDRNFYCFDRSLNLSDITKDYINDYNYNISSYSSSLLSSSLSYNDNIIMNSFIASFLTITIIIYMLLIKI